MNSDELAARMSAISEPRMRAGAMAEIIASGPAEQIVELLSQLIACADDVQSDHWTALDAAMTVLSEDSQLPYQRRAQLYEAAIERGREELALTLLQAAPSRPDVDQLEKGIGDERKLVPSGKPLTLGERKSLARGHRREVLMQIMRDPHPDVVAVLLRNPHVTESDVLRLATRRPTLPESLAAIAASDRWRPRVALRRALALNPYTPLPLAARLVTTLASGDVERVASDPALPDRLRHHARLILERRKTRWYH